MQLFACDLRIYKGETLKLLVKNIILIACVAMIVAASVWADQRSRRELCRAVDVRIVNDDSATFITRNGIMHELHSHNVYPEGKLVTSISTEDIEHILDKCDYLENVECYVANNNNLVIEARQFMPVMRVYDNGDSTVYYVNRNGKRMAVDGRYHIDVPVVEGDFTGRYQPTSLLPMLEYVASHPELDELVSMYSVKDSNNVFIVPSICGHVVNMGNVKDFDSKFKKLMLFYEKVMPHKGWNTYSEISLKWDYQVVGTLRSKKKPYEVPYNPEEDEQTPSLESVNIKGLVADTGGSASTEGKTAVRGKGSSTDVQVKKAFAK